jgi:hypothetical protein
MVLVFILSIIYIVGVIDGVRQFGGYGAALIV